MPARVGDVIAALYVGHQIGDHIAQTDHQAANKAGKGCEGWQAMAGHVASYTACQAVALLALRATGVRVSPIRAVLGLAVSAGTHALIDRRWPVQRLLHATGSPGFADLADGGMNGPYLADQALHVGCLFAAALVTADST